MRERLQDPTAHAEIIALREASESINSWRLTGCSVYATLEPCVMCGGALVSARVGRLVFGADDAKAGACGSVLDVINHPRLNHRIDVDSGILGTECGNILTRFFQAQRSLGKK
jgi:tRNA(adenine34) deaminase